MLTTRATKGGKTGAPDRNRTCDLRIRNPSLYGFEVQGKTRFSGAKASLILSQSYP